MLPFRVPPRPRGDPVNASITSVRDITVSGHMPAFVTDEAYPDRNINFHHIVQRAWFETHDDPPQRSTPLRIVGVFVPRMESMALTHPMNYIRLGLPTYLRRLFRKLDQTLWHYETELISTLDDPAYADTDDIWWVRAWPTDVLATTVAADGTTTKHDAADILRLTGRGFTVTVDLVFDFFYEADLKEGDSIRLHTRSSLWKTTSGPIVTVQKSVLTRLYDDRPEPELYKSVHGRDFYIFRPRDTQAQTRVVSPDAVLEQLAQPDSLVRKEPRKVRVAVKTKPDPDHDHEHDHDQDDDDRAHSNDGDHNDRNDHKVAPTEHALTGHSTRRTEDPLRDRPLPDDHVKLDTSSDNSVEPGLDTAQPRSASRRPAGWQARLGELALHHRR